MIRKTIVSPRRAKYLLKRGKDVRWIQRCLAFIYTREVPNGSQSRN